MTTDELAEMMSVIASDRPQRWKPEPLDDEPPHDARSLHLQHKLLRALEAWQERQLPLPSTPPSRPSTTKRSKR